MLSPPPPRLSAFPLPFVVRSSCPPPPKIEATAFEKKKGLSERRGEQRSRPSSEEEGEEGEVHLANWSFILQLSTGRAAAASVSKSPGEEIQCAGGRAVDTEKAGIRGFLFFQPPPLVGGI